MQTTVYKVLKIYFDDTVEDWLEKEFSFVSTTFKSWRKYADLYLSTLQIIFEGTKQSLYFQKNWVNARFIVYLDFKYSAL